MVYDIYLPSLIIFSAFSIIIILARKIPGISFENEINRGLSESNKVKPHLPASLFCLALSSGEKILRQIRINILKLDTKIFSAIEYLRRESAKRIEEMNRVSYKNIAKSAIGHEAVRISNKLQFKIEETKLLRTIAKNPKFADNYKKLGELYVKNNNFRDAEASFAEYLKLKPDDAEVEKMFNEVKVKTEKLPS